MYHQNIKDDQGFYFWYETDVDGEPLVDAKNFRVAFTSKKLLAYFNINSFQCIMWTIDIPQINRDTLY